MHNKFSPGTIIDIDGAEYRPQGYVNGRIHLTHTITGAAFVHPDKDGVVGMLTDEMFDDLLEAGADAVFSGEGEVALSMTEGILETFGATAEQIERESDRIRRELFSKPATGPA